MTGLAGVLSGAADESVAEPEPDISGMCSLMTLEL